MNDEAAKIGVVQTDAKILLTPFPNGGWTVTQQNREYELGKLVGAYSSAADLIDAPADGLGILMVAK